ncbi:hypothetical protein RhiTH_009597 [Rhizoctonia solani]
MTGNITMSTASISIECTAHSTENVEINKDEVEATKLEEFGVNEHSNVIGSNGGIKADGVHPKEDLEDNVLETRNCKEAYGFMSGEEDF